MFVLALASRTPNVGKTTSVRALASAFIATNKTVFIADTAVAPSSSESSGDDLGEWALRLLRGQKEDHILDFRRLTSSERLVENLETRARRKPVDILIIDTNTGSKDLEEIACRYADLVLRQSLVQELGGEAPSVLSTEGSFEIGYCVSTRANSRRPLLTTLPKSEIFKNQQVQGHVPDMLDTLWERTRETSKTPSRYKVSWKRRQAAEAAWASAQSLAWEVEWLARGYGLEGFDEV